MVELNYLKISFDNTQMDMEFSVPDSPLFTNVNIEKIAIVDQNHYTIGYPQNQADIELEITSTFPIEDIKITNGKHYKATIPDDLIKFKNRMFFVYVKTSGIPDPSVSCNCSTDVNVFVAVNIAPMYKLKLVYLQNMLASDASAKDNLVDIILKENMFVQSVEQEEYRSAIDIFNTLIINELEKYNGTLKSTLSVPTCNC